MFRKSKLIGTCLLITSMMIISSGCNEKTNKTQNTQTEAETTTKVTEDTQDFIRGRKVVHMWDGDVLVDEKWNFLSDLYDEILEEDLNEHRDYIRYVKDGKWGYLTLAGDIYINAQYSFASPLSKAAIVGDENSKWVVDEKGKKISKKFKDAYPFEDQDWHARVQDKKGKWGIVDTDGNMSVKCQFDKINELPYIYTLTSTVKTGKAYVISLNDMSVRELGKYCDIKPVSYGMFCNVKDRQGKTGLMLVNGEQVFKTKYKEIYVKSGEENIFMIVTKDFDGKCVTWKYDSSDKSLCEVED